MNKLKELKAKKELMVKRMELNKAEIELRIRLINSAIDAEMQARIPKNGKYDYRHESLGDIEETFDRWWYKNKEKLVSIYIKATGPSKAVITIAETVWKGARGG